MCSLNMQHTICNVYSFSMDVFHENNDPQTVQASSSSTNPQEHDGLSPSDMFISAV